MAVFLVVLAGFIAWMLSQGGVTPQEKAMRELNEPAAPLPKGDPPPLAAAGREIYDRQCVNCHGIRLSGGEAANLRARRYTPPRWEDQDLANVVYSGRGAMPAFRDKLSGGELAALVAYLRWEQGVPFGGPTGLPQGEAGTSPTTSPSTR